MDSYLLYTYGNEEFLKYKYGNKYQYQSNLVVILILALIFLLAIVFLNDVAMIEMLSLEGLIYLPILFPFILFYRSRIGKRNFYIDKGTSILYFTSYIVSHVMIFIVINLT